MKKLLTVLIILLAAGGTYAFFDRRDPPAVPVTQAAISRGDIVETVTSTGTLDALRTVQVGSQVSGVVSELDADYNSIVKKGDVIARLDPSLIQVQVDIQQANIDRQTSDINNLQLKVDNGAINLKRTRELFANQLVSQQDLEQAVLTDKANRAALASAKKQLVQARASLDQARLNLSYCTIRAPIDGVVIQRLVDRGQTVQSSMTAPQFFVLATELDRLKITAAVDEAEIGKIRPGQPVRFTVDAYRGETFAGTVDSVRLNSITTQNVVTYQTIVDVRNPTLKLLPGMTASLQIEVGRAQDVLRVSNTALRFHPTTDMYTALGVTPPAGATRPIQLAATVPAMSWSARAAAQGPPEAIVPLRERNADTIDELFPAYHEPLSRGRVWTWDPAAKEFEQVDVQVGISDGQNSVLVTNALTVGQTVVTGVLLPTPPAAMRPAPNPFAGPQRGGFRRY